MARIDTTVGSSTESRDGEPARSRLSRLLALLADGLAVSPSAEIGWTARPLFIALCAIGAVGTSLCALVVLGSSGWLGASWWRGGLGAAALLLAAAAAFLPWFRPASQRHRRLISGERAVRYLSLAAASLIWISSSTPLLALLAWPTGILLGLDRVAGARRIGSTPRRGRSTKQLILSPVHGGLAAACAVALLSGIEQLRSPALNGLVTTGVVFGAAVFTFSVVDRLLVHVEHQRLSHEQRVRRAEARHRAHWIHDDVCAEIRQLRLRMADPLVSLELVHAELNDFETRLRERQLDEVIAAGGVSAAEVLQPYVRKAQAAGLRIVSVPTFDEASVELDTSDARRLKRCVAGLVSNAIQAGATTLGFTLQSTGRSLQLTITDDAGGFDLSTVPAGRGLSMLYSELGDGRLAAQQTGAGTELTVTIVLGEK